MLIFQQVCLHHASQANLFQQLADQSGSANAYLAYILAALLLLLVLA